MNELKIIPVILSGGSGTRLWPLSRKCYPKQYLSINSKTSLTFFQETIKRFIDQDFISDPIIICNEEHRFVVAEQIRNLEVNPRAILLEPKGRNTAPAITLAALEVIEEEEDALLLILPSDHLIQDIDEFFIVLKNAIQYCVKNKFVTFGIKPNKPEAGYGYIESTKPFDYENLEGLEIVQFIEKPTKEVAMKLIKDKRFSWNSGMFFFKASLFLKEIKIFKPKLYNLCKKSLAGKIQDLDFQRIDHFYFEQCENISIDKAIMEKTKFGIVLGLNAGWNDIGNWESIWDVSKKDIDGNFVTGDTLIRNVNNSYIRSENRLIVAMGLKNMVVVETADAILVTDKNETQFVKEIVKDLESDGKSEANIHKTIYRPWGNYTSIAEGESWQVKKITVLSGKSLSLQMHKYRTEHWVVVNGTALVEINGEKKLLNKNESTYIPHEAKHRLSNPSSESLTLIEVQSGNYLGEDDIIRFEDNYGRK
tara:strand:- start:1188 stop:2624 length:1437 start_codon:yes stop_codon:yes gene_type:complete